MDSNAQQPPIQNTPQAVSPQQPPSRGWVKWVLPAIFAIVISLLFVFTPLPYYEKEDRWCESYPPTLCSPKGWHFGSSLWQRFSGQLEKPVSSTTQPAPTINPTDKTADWKTYTNKAFTFNYPDNWVISGNEIKSSLPPLRIYLSEDDSLMNECMEEISTNKQNGFFTRKFQRVITGAMCVNGDAAARELWIIPKEGAYGPGIIIYYSSKDEDSIEPIINKIISTFKFTS